ncbi:MAG: peptidase S8 [Anaerolineae bacterium]|nr:MAG: peptidase S8 [Anaerolineae bacterium]WKZ43251.1 MAG: S8 family serine peptidase [Anaerolineales bacterium]
MKRKMVYALMAAILVLSNAASVFAQEGGPDRFTGRDLPASVDALRLDTPLIAQGVARGILDRSLVGADGSQRVIIRLSSESGADAFERGVDTYKAKNTAKAQQDAFLNRVRQLDPSARVIGRVQLVLNAVFVEVDAAVLPALAQDSRVVRIAPVGNYEMDLSETVPYIGASAVHTAGYDGSGVSVAVLDSGIDYFHAALGGSGNPADYAANDPNVIEPGSFPTAKVVGGYDFVGSSWAGSSGPAESPDPDPLDDGPAAGHGTHVGHIIGGVGGVAPGVKLYAVKVCSSVSTSCSGIALIQGMEFAVDPNGDGKTKDHVDVVNMSLGSQYGQPFDDDLSYAVNQATLIGVLTVASSGNSGDKPYANGTPASAATALSVAQTSVPSAFLQFMRVNSPPSIAGDYSAVFQPWSAPLASNLTGPLQYGDGAGGNLNGCAVFSPGSLAGKIVLVDRGVCGFSIKISNIAAGGGLVGIIGLIAPGDPFEGGFGGGSPTIPGYMISQADSNLLKSNLGLGVSVTFDPTIGIPLVGTMVGSSSRGPQHEVYTLIKPEIGAPGASVSALAGTGTDEGPFGGTSGAAPMVSGSAALLIDKYGGSNKFTFMNGLAPIETKALLMNNAETNIINDALLGDLAPITRIGGGEVRVDRALTAPVAAWDLLGLSGSLSFGFVDASKDSVTLYRTVRVHNFGYSKKTYTITPTFRFPDDATSGAITISAPSKVVVNRGDTFFTVKMTINAALLPGNYMSSGDAGADPSTLTMNEFDGYLVLSSGSHTFQIPWHVLPRKDAKVVPSTTSIVPGSFPQVIGLNNKGVGMAQNDAYSLIAVSNNLPQGGWGEGMPTPDIRAVGVNTFPVQAGVCSASSSFVWAFAINTWERQEHLVPVEHDIYFDINQDGTDDYVVFNFDQSLSGSLSDGRQLTWSMDLSNGSLDAFFYTEHSTNTGNTVLYICGEQVGLTGVDMLATNVNIRVETLDWYNGGPGDLVDGLTVTPLGEQYYGSPVDVPGKTNDPAALEIYDYGLFPGNTPELGLLLLTNGDRGFLGPDQRGGATQDTEALLFYVP